MSRVLVVCVWRWDVLGLCIRKGFVMMQQLGSTYVCAPDQQLSNHYLVLQAVFFISGFLRTVFKSFSLEGLTWGLVCSMVSRCRFCQLDSKLNCNGKS